MKFARKPIRQHYLRKLKVQIFCRCGRKRKHAIFNLWWVDNVQSGAFQGMLDDVACCEYIFFAVNSSQIISH